MRKKIAFLITLVMVIGSVGPGVSAAAFHDTAGTSCETAVEVLAALGIVNGKTESAYEPESTLTRAEMATILLRAVGMEGSASGKNVFADVTADHWAWANIAAAHSLGIINGMSAEIFAPDSTVTYEQAVKMVVAALGYTLQAEAQGGYPTGYLSKAAQLDLLAGVSGETNMTRGNMAILLYNALDAPLFLQTTFGEDAFDYGVIEEATLLSYYLKVDTYKTHVSAIPTAQITAPARTLLSDEVTLAQEGLICKKGGTDAQNMLGIRAQFYVKAEEKGETPVILAAVPLAGSAVLDIEDVEKTSTKTQLVYTEDSREKKLDISGAVLVWNGRVKTDWTAADLQPETGTVRVIFSGTEAKYIIVESFTNYVVDTVVPDTMEIFFMQGKDPAATLDKVVVDPNDRFTALTDEIGEPLPIEGCARWDVVSVAESADKAVKKIIRCYNVVKGTVSEISDESVKINDKEYSVTAPLTIGSLELGQTAAYYLDFTGAVTAVNKTLDTSKNYGWLVNAATGKGLDGGVQIKLFTDDGEMKVFDTSDRVILDDRSYDSDKLLDGTNTLYQNGQLYPQLVKYKTNADGTVITELDTAENRTLAAYTDTEKTDGTFSMGYYMGSDRKSMEFDGTKSGGALTGTTQYRLGNIIFAKVRVSEETPVFDIPADLTRDDLYEVDTMNSYTWDVYNSTKYLAVYDVNEDFDVGACVVHNYLDYVDGSQGGSGGTGGGVVTPAFDTYPRYTSGKVGLITGISMTLDEDGEATRTLKIYNWLGGEEVIRIPEEFECLYRSANADFLQDPDWYNVKGQPRDETLLKSTSYDIPTSSYYGFEFRPRTMRLDASDLQPGDVLQYSAVNGTLAMASVVLRGAYPGKVEMVASPTANAQSKGNIDVTSETNFYLGSLLQMYATVVKTTENGPILTVNLSNMAGQPNGKTALRAIPTTGRFVLWNSAKQTMRTITPEEIRIGDELFSLWRTNTQMMVIVYR